MCTSQGRQSAFRWLDDIALSGNTSALVGVEAISSPIEERGAVMRRRRVGMLVVLIGVIFVLAAGPALACGGLLAPNGSINLVRTTTLAAYEDGVEHYITSFEFTGGGGGKFGSIVPLPDVPTKVSKAGRWTLQRLALEVQPPVLQLGVADSAEAATRSAEVVMETRVSALDITVLKGGGDEVGLWAKRNGFSLPPDAPEVLDFYGERSPIFMAVRFNLERAENRDLGVGDGVPVHVTIPTEQPWVPLRILGLGRQANEIIEADVFTLTETRPSMLPVAGWPGAAEGMSLERSEPASDVLLADLRSDRGMDWLPDHGMWLNYIRINSPASELKHDLALNVTGGRPSIVDAGLDAPQSAASIVDDPTLVWPWLLAAIVAFGVLTITGRFATHRR
jgi:hypothetical protein